MPKTMKNAGVSPTNAAAAKRGWGSPIDDYKFIDEDLTALDVNDPNFDEADDQVVRFGLFSPVPSSAESMSFNDCMADAARMKKLIHQALKAYLVSYDVEDFQSTIAEIGAAQNCPHEIAKIAISVGLDVNEDQRIHISQLLKHAFQNGAVSKASIEFAFRRLFNRLSELRLDVPNAADLLLEFTRRAVVSGYLDSDVADLLYSGIQVIDHPEISTLKKASISTMIDEYLVSEDAEEACQAVRDLNAPEYGHLIVKMLVDAAMDRAPRERELASRLLACLVRSSSHSGIPTIECEKGFQQLLETVEERAPDVPEILHLLSCFLARAISDECLSPAFASRIVMDLRDSDMGLHVVMRAQKLLGLPHAASRLDDVWGRPATMRHLKRAMDKVIEEYFSNSDVDDAVKRVEKLSAAQYGRQLVKRLFVESLDRTDREFKLAITLLQKLVLSETLSRNELKAGFTEIHNNLQEICIDAPTAPKAYERLCASAETAGIIE